VAYIRSIGLGPIPLALGSFYEQALETKTVNQHGFFD
jgi:hypothetical protein